MARPLRIEYPGAVYHVTARGNARRNIFMDDTDRQQFLTILASTIGNYNWLCHAYCIMDNHYHLLIETPDANLSLGMNEIMGSGLDLSVMNYCWIRRWLKRSLTAALFKHTPDKRVIRKKQNQEESYEKPDSPSDPHASWVHLETDCRPFALELYYVSKAVKELEKKTYIPRPDPFCLGVE